MNIDCFQRDLMWISTPSTSQVTPRALNMAVLAFGSLIPALFLTRTTLGLDGSSTARLDTSESLLSSHSRRQRNCYPPQVCRSWFSSFLVVYMMNSLPMFSQKRSFRGLCSKWPEPVTSRPLHAYQCEVRHPESLRSHCRGSMCIVGATCVFQARPEAEDHTVSR
jgi:hypothetical protein